MRLAQLKKKFDLSIARDQARMITRYNVQRFKLPCPAWIKPEAPLELWTLENCDKDQRFPWVQLHIVFDVGEKVDFEKETQLFYNALASLEQSRISLPMLNKYQKEYKKTGQETVVHMYVGKVGFYKSEEKGGIRGSAKNTYQNKLSGIEEIDKEVNLYIPGETPEMLAPMLFHELLHVRQHRDLDPGFLKDKMKSLDVKDVLFLNYCHELFADALESAFVFGKYGMDYHILFNHLALLMPNAPWTPYEKLGRKTALNFVRFFTNQINVADIPKKLPCMPVKFTPINDIMDAVEQDKECLDKHMLNSLKVSLTSFLYHPLSPRQITCTGKNVRRIFHRCLMGYFPEYLGSTMVFDVEKNAQSLTQKAIDFYEKELVNPLLGEKEKEKLKIVVEKIKASISPEKDKSQGKSSVFKKIMALRYTRIDRSKE